VKCFTALEDNTSATGDGGISLDLADVPNRYRLLGVLALAFILRTVWGIVIPVVPISDAQAYDILALNLSQHSIYGFTPSEPSAFWPVGTAAAYGVLYAIFGHSYAAVVIFNIVVGVAIVGLTMMVVDRWFGEATSFVAGLLVAVWPTLIQFTTIIASELIFAALVLAVVALVLAREDIGWRRAVLIDVACGVLMALAAYVRPIALLFPLLFGFIVLIRNGGFRRVFAFAAVTAMTMTILIAPWTLRNKAVLGAAAIVSTNGGVNLWMGNNPNTTGEYQPVPERLAHLSEAERDRRLKDEATAYIKEEPVAFIARTFVKALKLYASETIGTHWNEIGIRLTLGDAAILPLKLISQCFWVISIALCLFGIAAAIVKSGFRLSEGYYSALIIIAYMTVVYAVIVIQDRYHLPTIPYIAAFAALPITQWVAKFGGGRSTRRVAAQAEKAA
jgi:4-amino-4-deoxy-L-arabinose transferase-like glycosyltransferase